MTIDHRPLHHLAIPVAPQQSTTGFPAWAIILLVVAVILVAGVMAFNKMRGK